MDFQTSLRIPKVVHILVQRAEYLEYVVPGSKKTAKSRRWRVVFKGGANKMASDFVDDQDGCPTWNCEVTLDLVSPSDPVCLVVTDGNSRHIGQVVIPLNQIPQTGKPNYNTTQPMLAELEPTKKNSYPRGRLFYWIGALDFWPPGTKADGVGRSKSIRGSLSHLGRGLKSKSRHSKSPSMMSGAYPPSQMSGRIDSMAMNPNGSMMNLRPGQNSLTVPNSYNPFEDDGTASEYHRQPSEIDDPRPTGLPPMYNPGYAQSEYAASIGGQSRTGKSKNPFKKIKPKLSHSTLSLTEAMAKKAAGKDPSYQLTGSRHSLSSNYDRGSHMGISSPGSTNMNENAYNNWDGSTQPNNLAGSVMDDPVFQTPVPPRTDGVGEVAPPGPFESPGSTRGSNWGLHAEERPNKPIEEMSKREVSEYVMQLDKRLQATRAELLRVQTELERSTKQAADTENELNQVRLTLADLRNKLLEDNLTQYLELPSSEQPNQGNLKSPSGFSSNQFGKSNDFGGGGGFGGFFNQQPKANDSEPQSFLAKISALGINTKKFGASTASTNMSAPSNQAATVSNGWW